MSNLFFLRDIEGYDLEDKFDRVKRDYFTLDNEEIAKYVEEYELDTDELNNPGKHELRHFLERKLDHEVFRDLIDDVFDDQGEVGDSFNIKAYQLKSKINEECLVARLEELKGADLMSEEDDDSFSYVLQIDDFVDRKQEGVVDISFHVSGKQEQIPPSDIWWREDGEKVSIDDYAEELPEALNRDKDYNVETRIYSDAGLLAISNSRIDKTLQEEIRSAIQRWGRENGSR
jgi:hypothetical protein